MININFIEVMVNKMYRYMGLPASIYDGDYSGALTFNIYPNRRVEHLEKHGKKHRTRKKNSKRALKIIL